MSQCTLSKAFGVVPIVYADGDLAKHVPQQLGKLHSDVVIITPSDASHEVENLVPMEVYFLAVAKYLKGKGDVSETAFKAWEATAQLPEKMMFTKRVARWIEDKFDANFRGKPEIFEIACRGVNPEAVQTESLLRLLNAMREAVRQSLTPEFLNPHT